MYELHEHDPFEHGDEIDDSPYARSRLTSGGDIFSSSRGINAPSRWVFISRRADLIIVLVLLLGAGLGIMWFINQLPVYVETASAHYHWAKEMYDTWGTPSMRWLFINLVVGVIVLTSGLFSAFGGNGQHESYWLKYDKGRVHDGSPRPAFNASVAYNASETTFNGPGYESPVYNPYMEPAKLEMHPHGSRGSWDYGDDLQVQEREGEEGSLDEPYAVRAVPADALEMPLSRDIPTSGEMSPPEYLPEAEFSDGNSDIAPREAEVVETSSNVSDLTTNLDEATVENQKLHKMPTEPSIRFTSGNVPTSESSPSESEVLSKSHTFTIGRVIRRDQLVDFIDPVSGQLEGIDRNFRLDPVRSLHAEPKNQSREILTTPGEGSIHIPARQAVAAESTPPPSRSMEKAHPLDPVMHHRKNSVESIPAGAHHQRLPSNSAEMNSIPVPDQASASGEVTHPVPAILNQPSPAPVLKQRPLVYPPALLSQASISTESTSPPPSPPMEDPIPPPPPPHLKLPPAPETIGSSSIISSAEPSSVPPPPSMRPILAAESSAKPFDQVAANEAKKPPAAKKSNKPSTHIRSMSSTTVGSETGPSLVQEEQSSVAKPRGSSDGGKQIQKYMEGAELDRQETSSEKSDDLHQQIEDFLARFHENWRLQRQESLARHKKRE